MTSTLAMPENYAGEHLCRRQVPDVVSTDPEGSHFNWPDWQPTWPSEPQPLSTPIKAVVLEAQGDNCRLKGPIAVTIQWEDSCFIVENESLSHFGTGETVEGAVKDMFHSMCAIFQAYQDTPPEELDAGARELLAKHSRILERVA